MSGKEQAGQTDSSESSGVEPVPQHSGSSLTRAALSSVKATSVSDVKTPLEEGPSTRLRSRKGNKSELLKGALTATTDISPDKLILESNPTPTSTTSELHTITSGGQGGGGEGRGDGLTDVPDDETQAAKQSGTYQGPKDLPKHDVDSADWTGKSKHFGTEQQQRSKDLGAERHTPKQFGAEQHTPKQFGAERHTPKQFGAERHTPEQFGAELPTPKQFGAEWHTPEQFGAERHTPEQFGAEQNISTLLRSVQGTSRQSGADQRERVKQQQEEETPEQEGRKEKRNLVKSLGQSVRSHRMTIMSTFGISTLTCFLGCLMTYILVGPKNTEHITPDAIIKKLTADDQLMGETIKKGLEQPEVEKMVRQLMREEVDKSFSNQGKGVTRSEPKWTMSKEDLEDIKERQTKCEANLTAQEQKMAEIVQNSTEKIQSVKDSVTSSMGAMKETLLDSFTNTIGHMEEVTNSKLENERQRMEKIVEHVGKTGQHMENQGFLKIDIIGPILVILAAVDVLLGLCVFILCGRYMSRSGSRSEAHQRANKVAQPETRPPPPLINTNNTNILCLCFRDADETFSKTLGNQIMDNCQSRKLLLRSFVVNSMEDVLEIPACRVALVFVDPDEREMIIEDTRYHIGQGLRRHAVQRLLDSGVEVFIVIYNDPKSVSLPPTQLYNPKLGQVEEHAQLKKLKRKERVVSIRNKFHEHQSSLIIREINAVCG